MIIDQAVTPKSHKSISFRMEEPTKPKEGEIKKMKNN